MDSKSQYARITFPRGIESVSFDIKNFPSLGSNRHEPSSQEVIAHLKLLRAFTVLKELVVPGSDDEARKSKIWTCYLHMAVRKFIIFLSALRLAFPESLSKSFNLFMLTMVPPLDILLVWHTFLLRPKSMFDNFNRNGFSKFPKFPFPLYEINKHIDETFVYNPPEHLKKSFTLFIENYFIKCTINEPFVYDSYAAFDPELIKLPLACPNCKHELGQVPLYNDNNRSGFCESSFLLISNDNCSCGFNVYVNHNELRKRLLYNDVKKPEKMPFVDCYYAHNMNNVAEGSPSTEEIDRNIKDVIALNSSYYKQLPLLTFVTIMQHQFQIQSKPIIRDYILMSTIHATIPSTTAFVLHEDLVSGILRQEIFTRSINDVNWLSYEDLELSIEDSIRRYHNFFRLTKLASHPVIPTYDIEIVWSTHQLSQQHYFAYSRQKLSYVLDFCNEADGTDFDLSAEKTSRLYKTQFKKDYLNCCGKTKRKNDVLEDETADSDNEKAQRHNKLSSVAQEHRIKRSKSFPWDDESFSLATSRISSPVTPTSITPSVSESFEFIYNGKQGVSFTNSSQSSPGGFVTDSLFTNKSNASIVSLFKKKDSGSPTSVDQYYNTL